MRTVASLGAEDELRFKYEGFLEKAYASSVKQVYDRKKLIIFLEIDFPSNSSLDLSSNSSCKMVK